MLTGGASAVYGSDAVAGVVNIIYKKNFEGVAFDGQYGESAESDNQETQFGITFGTNTEDGRGNVMAHVGYTKQGAVLSRDRERSADRPDFDRRGHHGRRPRTCSTSRVRSIRASRRRAASSRPIGRGLHGITYDAAGNVIPWSTNGSATAGRHGLQSLGVPHDRRADRALSVRRSRQLRVHRGPQRVLRRHLCVVELHVEARAVSARRRRHLSGRRVARCPPRFDVDGVLTRNPLVPDEVFNTAADERRRRPARLLLHQAHGRLRPARQQRQARHVPRRGRSRRRVRLRQVALRRFLRVRPDQGSPDFGRPGQRAELPQRARSHSGRG